MPKDEGYPRLEDLPTRPVQVPRLRPVVLNDSVSNRIEDIPQPRPSRDPTPKLGRPSRW